MTPFPDQRKPVYILAVGTAGDMYPLLRIALALQRRGHPVRFLGPEIHARNAQQAGVPFQSIVSTADYLTVLNDPDIWHPRKSMGVILRSLHLGKQQVLDFAATLSTREECVLLVHPLAVPVAAIIHAMLPATRIVTVYLAPANLRTLHNPLTLGPLKIPRWLPLAMRRWLWRRIDAHMIDPAVLPDLNTERQTRGLAPVRHFAEHMYDTADLSVTLFPAWFGPHQPDWPQPMYGAYFQLYDPRLEQDLPPTLEQFLAGGEPPIVFTPGSGNLHAAPYFDAALRATERLGRRAIFLTPHREQVPRQLPGNVLWQDYVPLRSLLPRVAALVHHGGIGTTAEALRAGTPQLVVPLAHDQFDNAARVCSLGVGSTLSISRLRGRKLERVLRKLLSSETVRAQCRMVAARFAEDDDEDALCQAIVSA